MIESSVLRRLILFLLAGILVACSTGGEAQIATTPTEVALVRRIATVGATVTPDPNATRILPTLTPSITAEPSATPYVGVFLGEAESDLLAVEDDSPPVQVVQPIDTGIRVVCPIPIDEVFGAEWQQEQRLRNALGCPIQEQFGFESQVQIFENGIAYLRQTETISEVWMISPGGVAQIGQYWQLSQIPLIDTGGVVPPSGRIVPEGAIGAVWLGVPQARETLGWATTERQPVGVNVQRFAGGTLFLDLAAGQVFALLVNGDAYGPY